MQSELSASSGEKRNLRWTKKCNQRNSGSASVMSNCWPSGFGVNCWTVARVFIEELNGVDDDHQYVATEQLFEGAARKGNERGANVHEKSLIWAAKDTEWKKLEEKGAVRILSSDSADKAKTQFANRFIPSRYVVTRPNPEELEARWCLRGYLDPDVMELVGSGSTQSPTVSQLERMLTCQMIVSKRLESAAGRHSRCLLGGRRSRQCTRVFVPEEFQECQIILGEHLWFERCVSKLVEEI